MSLFKHIFAKALVALLLLSTACKKENTKENLQEHVAEATDVVLTAHSLTQLAISYLKGINDSILLADGFNEIYSTYYYLSGDEISSLMELKYTYSRLDAFERYREGTINVNIEGGLHEEGGNASFDFIDFHLDRTPEKVSANSFTIRNLGVQDDEASYRHDVQSFVFQPDSTSIITASASLTYRWIKANPAAPYFHIADQFEITGTIDLISRSGETATASISNTLVLGLNCIYFIHGSMQISFGTLEPKNCTVSFRTSQQCEAFADLQIGEMRFFIDLMYPYTGQ